MFDDSGTDDLLHVMFERWAERTPDSPAIVHEGVWISYADLDRRAEDLARSLRDRGVVRDAPVAILADRSPEAVVAMLGVLKAGGACAPFDPMLPEARLTWMFDHLAPVATVACESTASCIPESIEGVLFPGEGHTTVARSASSVLGSPESLAYVVFTSGSLGEPKAVAVEHRHVSSYVRSLARRLRFEPGTTFATVSSISADLGYSSVFGALCTGGCLHLMSRRRCLDGRRLADYFDQHPIDFFKIVPSHLATLGQLVDPSRLMPRRWLVLGGEALAWERAEEWCAAMPAGGRVFNHYGPTECTIGALMGPVDPTTREEGRPTVPLGEPMERIAWYLLDRDGRPVAAGGHGELYLAGAQVARGYWKRPDVSRTRFLPDPFANEPGARMYRTGDLCRLSPSGCLEFVGRVDRQIKLHGYRVELEEIEHVLGRHPAVASCAVEVRAGGAMGDQLIAFVVSRAGCEVSTGDLRRFLDRRLPRYMVPLSWSILESMPRLANDKIDRRALRDSGMVG